MGLFRKVSKTPVYNTGVSELSFTDIQKNSVKDIGDSSVAFSEFVKVPTSTLESLPTLDEFDFEEQLKNGYVPQPINVNGMLDIGVYNPQSVLDKLNDIANSNNINVDVNNNNENNINNVNN